MGDSAQAPFRAIAAARLSRRTLLGGGLAAMAAFLAGPAAAGPRDRGALLGFRPLPSSAARGPMPAVSADYEVQALLPWGEPLAPDGPAFRHPPVASEQALQIGIGHDGLWFFPVLDPGAPRGGWDAREHWDDARDWCANTLAAIERHGSDGNVHGLLALNHEFGSNRHVLGRRRPRHLDDVRTSQHAHGVSIVELRSLDGRWQAVPGPYARRVHARTPVRFSGPAAGHALLATPSGTAPRGTVNNCAMGYTPWGTYLTCEENVHGYFGATGRRGRWKRSEGQARYGYERGGLGYGWHRFDHRFDLSDPAYRNEEHRFGWIVEIDPWDPKHVPVKRTALGRMRHEGIALGVGPGGRIVGYMGDDQAFDYVYRFVSDDDWRAHLARGESPLDHGRLQAARFHADGTGRWLELSIDESALADRFGDQGELLVNTRLAADAVGATPMDRPEWTTVAPDGSVYCSLTGNAERATAGVASPVAPNLHGHVVRWRDDGNGLGDTFTWDVFGMAAATHGTAHAFSGPDGLWADPDGRLFIETDGFQPDGTNNQLLVADTVTGEIRRLLSGVPDDEITGLAVTPDRTTLFLNVQHAGKGDPSRTNFPAPPDGRTVPRDATLAIRRKDGGVVGS